MKMKLLKNKVSLQDWTLDDFENEIEDVKNLSKYLRVQSDHLIDNLDRTLREKIQRCTEGVLRELFTNETITMVHFPFIYFDNPPKKIKKDPLTIHCSLDLDGFGTGPIWSFSIRDELLLHLESGEEDILKSLQGISEALKKLTKELDEKIEKGLKEYEE